MANNIGWGKINEISWFGDANASNGWGADYPFDADGSFYKITEWINWRHFFQLSGVARYFLPPQVRNCSQDRDVYA